MSHLSQKPQKIRKRLNKVKCEVYQGQKLTPLNILKLKIFRYQHKLRILNIGMS